MVLCTKDDVWEIQYFSQEASAYVKTGKQFLLLLALQYLVPCAHLKSQHLINAFYQSLQGRFKFTW